VGCKRGGGGDRKGTERAKTNKKTGRGVFYMVRRMYANKSRISGEGIERIERIERTGG
jgi:hypothetical protein